MSNPDGGKTAATKVLEVATAILGSRILAAHARLGEATVLVVAADRADVARALMGDPFLHLDMLMDHTVVDLLDHPDRLPDVPRFELVDHFFSTRFFHRLRVKCLVSEENPTAPSLAPLYGSAVWMEREAYDLYGVLYEGHPDLRRILLYPEFVGHPLRKDYDKLKEQPLFTPRYLGVRESDPPTRRR